MLMAEAQNMYQTAGIQTTQKSHPVRVITVTSGKGGVGKTNVSANLAIALSNLGQKVLIMDADLGLGNIDVLLGLHPKHTLESVIQGEHTLDEVMVTGPSGLKVIPAASGIKNMAELSSNQHAGIIQAFSQINQDIDVLIIDTAAGIADSVVSFACAAQEVLVVVCDEPASITDAYALIKLLHKEYGLFRFRILANMVKSVQKGREVYDKLVKVTDRFLDVALEFSGSVPYDESVLKAIRKQRAVVEAFPRSQAAVSYKQIAEKTIRWPIPKTANGHLEFFVERLIQGNTLNTGINS